MASKSSEGSPKSRRILNVRRTAVCLRLFYSADLYDFSRTCIASCNGPLLARSSACVSGRATASNRSLVIVERYPRQDRYFRFRRARDDRSWPPARSGTKASFKIRSDQAWRVTAHAALPKIQRLRPWRARRAWAYFF